MASYENPTVREGINVSPHSGLAEFLKLSAALAAGIVALVLALTWGFRWLAPAIPFHWEHYIAAPVAAQLGPSEQPAKQQYLQALAEQLAKHMDFPANMPIQVHWLGSTEPNAFATVGGHIAIHQGLIDSIHSENGLAMVIAHELAHVRQRDPLVSAGSGLVLAASMAMLLGSGSESIVGRSSAALTQLQFSRKQEQAADAAALEALRSHYGHLHGADEFFTAMLGQSESLAKRPRLEFLQTHPDTGQRAERIQAAAAELDASHAQMLTELPAWLQTAHVAVP